MYSVQLVLCSSLSFCFLIFSLTPKSKLVESSEFLHVNEDDKVGRLPNLNGKSGSWTFEELIDLGVHSKTAVITVDSMNQNLIDAAGIPEGPKVAFEDKTVMAMSKPMEAVSGRVSSVCSASDIVFCLNQK